MDRPVPPLIAPQRRALNFALDALGLRDAHAQVVEDDRVLGLAREVTALRAENARLRATARALRAEITALEQARYPDAEALDAWAREHERRHDWNGLDRGAHALDPAPVDDHDRPGVAATREADAI